MYVFVHEILKRLKMTGKRDKKKVIAYCIYLTTSIEIASCTYREI